MRNILILVLSFCAFNGECQKSIRIFSGINVSNSKYRYIDHILNSDSIATGDNYILPTLGLDIFWPMSQSFGINSGLELGWLGSRKYLKNIPIDFNIDSNLRMGYLRIPVGINQKVFKKTRIKIGYNFNYFFRKNQTFFVYDLTINKSINIYKPFYHSLSFGLLYDFAKFNLEVKYERSLSPVFDSKDFYPDGRVYLKLSNFQFSIGYSMF